MAGKDRYACLFIEDRLRLFRGAAASVPLLGLDLKTGYIVGTTAMAGDLVASFVKSHLGLLASHGNGARSDSRIAPSSALPPGRTLFEPNRHHLRRPDFFVDKVALARLLFNSRRAILGVKHVEGGEA